MLNLDLNFISRPDGDGSQLVSHQHGVTPPTSWSTQVRVDNTHTTYIIYMYTR